MLETLLSVPMGVFLVLLGLLWEPQQKTKKELKAERSLLEIGEEVTDDLTPEQTRNYLRRVAMRIGIVILGSLGIVVGLLSGSRAMEDTSALAGLFGLYAGLMLVVQRVEKNRRVFVLFVLGVGGLLVWRFANYREYEAENEWAVLLALFANFGFWYLIGRRFPPPDSDDVIEVVGME